MTSVLGIDGTDSKTKKFPNSCSSGMVFLKFTSGWGLTLSLFGWSQQSESDDILNLW